MGLRWKNGMAKFGFALAEALARFKTRHVNSAPFSSSSVETRTIKENLLCYWLQWRLRDVPVECAPQIRWNTRGDFLLLGILLLFLLNVLTVSQVILKKFIRNVLSQITWHFEHFTIIKYFKTSLHTSAI